MSFFIEPGNARAASGRSFGQDVPDGPAAPTYRRKPPEVPEVPGGGRRIKDLGFRAIDVNAPPPSASGRYRADGLRAHLLEAACGALPEGAPRQP